SVDDDAGHGVGGCTIGDVPHCGGTGGRGRHAVAVVLAHENHRQLPDRCHVQRFVERALIVGSVTEEGDDHLSGLHLLGGEGCTHCDRNATRNDAVGPEIAFGNVGYVHG